jgi:hypothetical protein
VGVSLAVQGCHRKVDIRLRTHARNVQLVSLQQAVSVGASSTEGAGWCLRERASEHSLSRKNCHKEARDLITNFL